MHIKMAARQEEESVADDVSAENVNLSGIAELSEELDHFMGVEDSKHTKAVVATSVNVLSDYCTKSAGTTLAAVEEMSPRELCDFLQSFYTEVRQKDGSFYARRSMLTLRYGLQRHFQKVLQVDITKDFAFKSANDVFNAVLSNLKTSVKMSHVRKKNMAKIRASSATDCSTPKGLQNTVFLDLMLHLCCSSYGRRNLRGMKKSHFRIMTDPSSNRRFVCFANRYMHDRMGSIEYYPGDGYYMSEDADSIDYGSNQNRMYDTPDKPESCPVACFEKYITKLNPMCEVFWQRPKKMFSFSPSDHYWYEPVPLGKNTLGNKMRDISAEAGCSIVYSNRCLKVTSKLNNPGSSSWNGDAITSSSDDDGSSSEDDEQIQENTGLGQDFCPQEHDDQLTFGDDVDVSHDAGTVFSVKSEEGETDYHYQSLPNPSGDAAQNGIQHTVAAQPSSGTAHPSLNQNHVHLYPVHTDVSQNCSVHQRHASEQQRDRTPSGINQNHWNVERSWLDENNQRKYLLTERNSLAPAPPNAWGECADQQNKQHMPNHLAPNQSRQDVVPNRTVCDAGGQRLSSSHTVSGPAKETTLDHGFRAGNRPALSGTQVAQSVTAMSQIGVSGGSTAATSVTDDQLLQLQKDVLRMQRENLALERRKIEMEMSKLEAETLKLQAERRKLTIEGDKLQQEMR